jgi:hypothetical protein
MLPNNIQVLTNLVNANEKAQAELKEKISVLKNNYPADAKKQLKEDLCKHIAQYINNKLGTQFEVYISWMRWNCKSKTKEPFKIHGVSIVYQGSEYAISTGYKGAPAYFYQYSSHNCNHPVGGVTCADVVKCLQELAKADKFSISKYY